MNPAASLHPARAARLRRPLLGALAAALMLAGCAIEPAVAPAAPTLPAAWKAPMPAAAAALDVRWWRGFGDPVLESLVQRAAEHNTDIAVAAARLAEARALIGEARARQRPQLDVQAGLQRGREGFGAPTRSLGQLGLAASVEVDLFGRLGAGSKVATLDAGAREALLAATRTAVQADVASAYLSLRATEAEQRLVDETIGAYRETLGLTERRHAAGDVAELDVVRARAELAATEAEARGLVRQRAGFEHALALLTGQAPADLTVTPAMAAPTLPEVPAGLPAELLRRRADVVATALNLQAAQQRLGIAQAAWLPQLLLTAQGGVASSDLGDLLARSARAWSVGALLALPIFDGGAREAREQQALARLDEAQAQHRAQVLAALREVEDGLVALHTLREQARAQQVAVAAASRASALSATRWRNGLVSQLEWLDAQRSELRNRRVALQVEAARAQATVGLVRALGGGWQASSAG